MSVFVFSFDMLLFSYYMSSYYIADNLLSFIFVFLLLFVCQIDLLIYISILIFLSFVYYIKYGPYLKFIWNQLFVFLYLFYFFGGILLFSYFDLILMLFFAMKKDFYLNINKNTSTVSYWTFSIPLRIKNSNSLNLSSFLLYHSIYLLVYYQKYSHLKKYDNLIFIDLE